MPTISGIRRRGYTPEALRNFIAAGSACHKTQEPRTGLLEHFVREDLNQAVCARDGGLEAAKVVIDNYSLKTKTEVDGSD